MNFNLHWVSNKYVEVQVDSNASGTLDADEALELAKDLINLASELLQVDKESK